MFYTRNLEEMLLHISVSVCTFSVMCFSSLRTQVSHTSTQFCSTLTFYCISETVSLADLPGGVQCSPRHHPSVACVVPAVVDQKWHGSTRWQAISDLVCSNMFIACKFWPINCTTWGCLRRGNVGVVCRCKWRWLGMVSKGSVFGGVKLVQRERNGHSDR